MPETGSKHVPLRRCVVCRRSRPQAELLRLYRDSGGAWQLDLGRKAGGRGAWLCKDAAGCRQPKALKRFFRQQAGRIADELAALGDEADAPETKARDETGPDTKTAARNDRQEARNGGMNAR